MDGKLRIAHGATLVTRETHVARLRRRPRRSDAVRSALAPVLDALVRADRHLLVNDDPDCVHAARVATRRLRSSLKVYAPMLRACWTTEARAALGASLPRDEAAAVARIAAPIATARETAYALLHAALRESWYIALLDTLLAAVRVGWPLARGDRVFDERAFVARTMRRSWKKLHRAVSRIGPGSTVAELHALRIVAKQTRYVADALAPMTHGRRLRVQRRFVQRLARLQDRLGAIHDPAVACDALHAIAASDSFVRGELSGFAATRGAALQTTWNAA